MANGDRHVPFAQRHGFEDLPEPMKVGEISDDLRRRLWNWFDRLVQAHRERDWGTIGEYQLGGGMEAFSQRVLGEYQKIPEIEVDTSPETVRCMLEQIVKGPFPNPIMLVELAVNDPFLRDSNRGAVEEMAAIFEKSRAPYRLDTSERPYAIFPRASKEASDAVLESEARLKEGGYEGALSELHQANEDIRQGNYRGAIAHSIHAVESVAKLLVPGTKTLGPALKELEKRGLLKHGDLASAFHHLYKYTSDEPGVRHALLEKGHADVGLAEALFFRTACAGFADYLAAKARDIKPEGDQG